ncbi:FAD-binding protein [Shigella flexneri]
MFSERYVLDLVKNQDGEVGGTAWCIETGEVVYFKARATVLATAGAGRYPSAHHATPTLPPATVSGWAILWRCGGRIWEMWQFHPTGIAGVGAPGHRRLPE